MDEHAQTVGNFLDGRHAKAAARIAALEAELAERTRERDELRYEKRARSAIDPNERLHNLCDGLAESRRESPYDQESWDLADACNRELQAELAERTRELEECRRSAFDRAARCAVQRDTIDILTHELDVERKRREAAEAILRDVGNFLEGHWLSLDADAHFARHKD